MFPGSREVLRVNQEVGQLIFYSATGSAEEVSRFHRDALERGGFAPGEGTGDQDLFTRGEEQVQLFVRQQEGKKVSVALFHKGGAAPGR